MKDKQFNGHLCSTGLCFPIVRMWKMWKQLKSSENAIIHSDYEKYEYQAISSGLYEGQRYAPYRKVFRRGFFPLWCLIVRLRRRVVFFYTTAKQTFSWYNHISMPWGLMSHTGRLKIKIVFFRRNQHSEVQNFRIILNSNQPDQQLGGEV